MPINFYELEKLSSDEIAKILKRSEIDISEFQQQVVPIIKNVQDRGDLALLEYNEKFDQAKMTPQQLKVTEAEFEQARKNLDPEIKAVIEKSAVNIKKFHEAQMPEETKLS